MLAAAIKKWLVFVIANHRFFGEHTNAICQSWQIFGSALSIQYMHAKPQNKPIIRDIAGATE